MTEPEEPAFEKWRTFLAALAEISQLHKRGEIDGQAVCIECRRPYPCSTRLVIKRAQGQ